jgi:UDP-N-acetylmuramoylalanine--D-glutamate ligase
MSNNSNIFKNKKILIYGLGKSGISTFNFLKKYNEVFLFDDYQKKNLPSNIKKNIISQKKIDKIKFDLIILSPGIDINKCKLKKFLHINSGIIYTDLIFFIHSIKIPVSLSQVQTVNPPLANYFLMYLKVKNLMLNLLVI